MTRALRTRPRPGPAGRTGLARLAVAWLAGVAAPAAAAPDWFAVHPDAELLGRGVAAYEARDCATALVYFYAYVQREPVALARNAAQRNALSTALSVCDARVRGASREAKGDDPAAAALPALPALSFATDTGAAAPGAIGRCDIYASIAVAQQRANLAQRCGLRGPEWSEHYRYHYDWFAAGASAAATRAGTAERQQRLEACRP